MFKIIGSCMVIFASMGLGFTFCDDLEKKLQVLRDIRQMMIHIMNRIEVECDSLAEAFLHTANRSKEPFAQFLLSVYKRLSGDEGCTVNEIWKAESLQLKIMVPKDELCVFESCMDQTGFSRKGQQIQVVREYIGYLEKQIEEIEKSKAEKCKLYRTIGVMSGLLLVIILW